MQVLLIKLLHSHLEDYVYETLRNAAHGTR